MDKKLAVKWHVETDEVVTGMADWRAAHPKATLKEIELQMDVLFAKMKARMLAEAALEAADEPDDDVVNYWLIRRYIPEALKSYNLIEEDIPF